MPLYSSGDWRRQIPIRKTGGKESYRMPWRRDYARLIHCPSFRRLQGKTQVFPGRESDFFRNRLTHSLEVAQIAKSIAIRLNHRSKYFRGEENNVNPDVAELAGLAHDLGHPPFGHNGEAALDECMRDCGGFEGNAQTFRILSRLERKELKDAETGGYAITPKLMNPNSSYYLAINMGFPNAFDAANDRDGSFIMIHGNCASVGCYAMTDEQIGEIYALARDAFLGGQPAFQVQAYPFRMTPENLARHRTNPNMPFWQMLKVGSDHFEATHLAPSVDVCDRRYVFDARPVPGSSTTGSSTSLAFAAEEPCPVFAVDPTVAKLALKKQRADDDAYAQLVKDNVPVAPIHTGLDGGMNGVFHPPFPYNFISLANVLLDGSPELPPLQPVPYLDSYRAMTGSMTAP